MNNYRRKGAYRLRGYDYSSEGAYFITVCTHNRIHFFGEIHYEAMQLSEAGKIVEEEWAKTPNIRQSIQLTLDAYCVMPNHFHALLVIGTPELADRQGQFPATDAPLARFGGSQSQTVGAVIRGFKGSCTQRIRTIEPLFRWQNKYYDHIVRDRSSWKTIRNYITDNPRRWHKDRFYT